MRQLTVLYMIETRENVQEKKKAAPDDWIGDDHSIPDSPELCILADACFGSPDYSPSHFVRLAVI
jgi:hypothetical protein